MQDGKQIIITRTRTRIADTNNDKTSWSVPGTLECVHEDLALMVVKK